MTRTTVNAIVDAVAFTACVLLAATGTLMKFVLPPGSGHFRRVWEMDRHGWGDIHFWIAIVLVAAVIVHVVLHWQWIVSVVKGRSPHRSGARGGAATIGVLILAAVAVAPFFATVEQGGEPPHKLRSLESPLSPTTVPIDGTMSLDEVQQRTGVPASVILKELGLPANVPTDERLGRLRKQYGFDMHRLREAVEKHQKP